MNNYQLLIKKLDRFIRKYYLNKLIRGLLYTIGLVLAAFLIVNLLEHFFYFSPFVRKVLFYGFIALATVGLVWGVIVPLIQYFKLGKVISHRQAASIIGTHFKSVKDKLLNILQLKDQASSLEGSNLIEASIDQKIEEIKLVPFRTAIDLGKNRKYLKYAAIPALLFAAILFASPNLIQKSTERLINNDKVYEREAPFSFKVENPALEVLQFDDYELEVSVEGNTLPERAQIHINGYPYSLQKKGPSTYAYTFKKVQKEVNFFLEASGFQSQNYQLKVLPKPVILSFEAHLDYPGYTGKKDEIIKNTGDLSVPQGTKVRWEFEAQNTETLQLKFDGADSLMPAVKKGEQLFSFSKRLLKDTGYSLFVSNEHIAKADSISYYASVKPDLHPSISAEQIADSTDVKLLYFIGKASDDYGIKKLDFHYNITNEKGSAVGQGTKAVGVEKNRKSISYDFHIDATELSLKAGDQMTYYFQVWDNDGVNGSKSSKSQTMQLRLPSLEEMEALADQNADELKGDFTETVEEAKELRQEIKELKDKIVQKEELDWEDRNEMEQLLQKHQQFQKDIENIQQNFEENLEQQEEFKEFSESVKEKQEKLQEMMDELLTDEMKEMLEKMEEMLEEMENEEMLEELEEMELSDEQLERELERMMELMKQLELEQKMQETIEDLHELADEQEELAEETAEEEGDQLSDEKEQQQEIEDEFEKIKEDLSELEQMNDDLNSPVEDMEQNSEKAEEVSEQMDQAQEQMEQQQSQQASDSQQKSSEKMREMAENTQGQLSGMQQQQAEEDMQAIRQLLENLIKMSLDQEDLMDRFGAITTNNSNYVELVQEQFKLKDDFQLIEDSLIALSKRVFELESFILKELSQIDKNFEDGIASLEDRKIGPSTANQQYVMTSVNNLALMLSESLQQMQMQMEPGMPGSGNCNKPGGMGSKPCLSQMSQMQKQLNQQLKEMMEGMQKGQQGKEKDGKGGQKQGGMSEQMAKAAAKQAAIRNALRGLNEEMNKDGDGDLGDLEKLMEEMEKTETDIVNKQITREMIERQNEIMTRLLEAEEAERKRELDNKREAQTAQNIQRKIPPEIEEYLKKREAETRLYKTVPPSLKPYYKSLVEQYFKNISL